MKREADMHAWGVDGCKKGWFFIGLGNDHMEYGVVQNVRQLLDRVPQGSTVLIDIPIGLRTGGNDERLCDLAARKALSPGRTSSVFPVPCRQAVHAKTYEDALVRNSDVMGKKLSKQTWGIVPRIQEVDSLLTSEARSAITIREVHPEVCFGGLAGHPMRHSKKSREGVNERLEALEEYLPSARATVASAFLEHGGFEAARDDIIDAMVAALCARHIDQCLTLPAEPELDDSGLPMEMVYLPAAVR